MNVISALNNQFIQDSLKSTFPDIEFLLPDIAYQDGLIEALKSKPPDALIINLEIEGDRDKQPFIQALRDINDTVKIILILKSQDKEYSNWLVSQGVYDVFIDGQCTFEDIHEAILKEPKVIVKTEVQKEYIKEYIEKEKIITKEKVIKEAVNFKKLTLCVWGSPEFACELAYITARFTDFKVILADLDFISPKADIYLNLQIRGDPPQHFGVRTVFEALERKKLAFNIFEEACLKRKELNNLYVLMDTGDTESFDRYKDKDIPSLIDSLYQSFDITILILNKSVLDPITISALSKSDFNIISIPANADAIREFETCFLYMKVKHDIPIEKCRFVAFDYKENINYPISYLKDMFTAEFFLGAVAHTDKREAYKNINSVYANLAFRETPMEYIEILSKFNIVPKRALKDKVKDWVLRKFGKLFKHNAKSENKPKAEAKKSE